MKKETTVTYLGYPETLYFSTVETLAIDVEFKFILKLIEFEKSLADIVKSYAETQSSFGKLNSIHIDCTDAEKLVVYSLKHNLERKDLLIIK